MKKITVILIIIIWCTPSFAEDWFSWDKSNTELHKPLTALYMLDMSQTLYIAEHPEEYHEEWNIYLSRHPSKEEVYTYFAASYILTTAIVWALPSKEYEVDVFGRKFKFTPSNAFQLAVIGIEGTAVSNNLYLSIGFAY